VSAFDPKRTFAATIAAASNADSIGDLAYPSRRGYNAAEGVRASQMYFSPMRGRMPQLRSARRVSSKMRDARFGSTASFPHTVLIPM
jgi:hypothetical protein